jgi:hypothetical protein
MYVEACTPLVCKSALLTRFQNGYWARTWDISKFKQGADQKRSTGLTSKNFSADFEKGLEIIDSNDAIVDLDPHLERSLCKSIVIAGKRVLLDKPIVYADEVEEGDSEGAEVDTMIASKAKGAYGGTSDDKKRKREVESDKKKKNAIDPAVVRAVKKDISGLKRNSDQTNATWTIQDHFDFYFSNLETKYNKLTTPADPEEEEMRS